MKLNVIKTSLYFIIFKVFFIKIRQEFAFLFYDKEGRAILGRRYINLWFLIAIFFLTFLAIGLANGSLEYLKEKMDDPFISWLNIDIPSNKSDKVELIINNLKDSTNKARSIYKYKFVTGFNFFSLNFYDLTKGKSRNFYGRTIDINDPLLKDILSKDFFKRGRPSGFSGNNDIGIIVTEKLLSSLNYRKDEGFIAMDFSENDVPRKILIPVVGVVKELPSFTDFLCTQHFHDQRFVNIEFGNAFAAENTRSVSFITRTGEKSVEKFRKQLMSELKLTSDLKGLELNFPGPSDNTLSYLPYTQIDITIYDDTSLVNRDKIFNAIASNPNIESKNFQRYYDFYPNLTNDKKIQKKYDRISIQFPNIKDKIKDFKKFMSEPPYELNIELGQIEAMENYNFISKLTRIISLILMIFSIISISLFISNLMQNHLEKIKMNIGTFLAFGINFKALERIYLSVIYLVLISSLLSGMLLAWIFGKIGFARFLLYSLGQKLEEKQNYYEQFSWWTIILVLIVLITSFFSITRITRKIFRQTPGDLLYERD